MAKKGKLYYVVVNFTKIKGYITKGVGDGREDKGND